MLDVREIVVNIQREELCHDPNPRVALFGFALVEVVVILGHQLFYFCYRIGWGVYSCFIEAHDVCILLLE